MTNKNIVIVLGKRLNQNSLTAEGMSRIDYLVKHLDCCVNDQSVIAFCGGITSGQVRSEAEAMYDYFKRLESKQTIPFAFTDVLLEKDSTNTVENIQNVAKELVKSGVLTVGEKAKITFVSNDYHLKRIFEIQHLMDEQGLLGVLLQRCKELGVELDISYQLSDHLCVPYPHTSVQGEFFLLMDVLTTYRVYLEGVVSGAFVRDLDLVRDEPYKLAMAAIDDIKSLLANHPQFHLVQELLALLIACIENTTAATHLEVVKTYLALLDTNLTLLNRYLDPEEDHTVRWWR